MDEGWFTESWDTDTLAARRGDLCTARLDHVRCHMATTDVGAVLLVDPNDIAYATGAMNMQIFHMRAPARYLLILADGPTVLFDYRGCEHLAAGLSTIDEIGVAEGLDVVTAGDAVDFASARFAAEIASTIRSHDVAIDSIAVDRFPFRSTDALRAEGFRLTASDEVLSVARSVKLPIELPYMREALRGVEHAVAELEQHAEPGSTEAEVWAHFHFGLMARQGQHTVTRLFQSGPRTFPYFQECGARRLESGDLLCLDTDASGYENYSVDFSRTFLCGDDAPTGDQRTLYGRAREQLEWNAALLTPGMSFAELAARAWRVPDEHQQSRYYCIGHGLGMAGEWPNIAHADPSNPYPLDGTLDPGMVICLESYIGWDHSHEGVKLEDQFLVLGDRVERMSTYPFDDRLSH